VLIPLHVAAALYHQFIRRDDVLRRMLPRRRASLEAAR
jgi:cytochrome b561